MDAQMRRAYGRYVPAPIAFERVVAAAIDDKIVAELDHAYQFWTGKGPTLVTKIVLSDLVSGQVREMIPNSPRHYWGPELLATEIGHYMHRIRDQRQIIEDRKRRQEQEQKREDAEREKKRIHYSIWFDGAKQPAQDCHRKRRVIDEYGRVWYVLKKDRKGVVIAYDKDGQHGIQTIDGETPLAYFTRKDETQMARDYDWRLSK